jgi:DNA-binding protein Fis
MNYVENSEFSGTYRKGLFFDPLDESGADLENLERSLEIFYFKEALHLSKGNESRAAQLLNLNHHTFRYRRKKHGIE